MSGFEVFFVWKDKGLLPLWKGVVYFNIDLMSHVSGIYMDQLSCIEINFRIKIFFGEILLFC